MSNRKMAALAMAAIAATGLVQQPAFSQTVSPSALTAQLVLQPAQPSNSAQQVAARELYRLIDLNNELVYDAFAGGATSGVQESLAGSGKTLTDSETQQLYSFWYRKGQEIFSPENVESAVVSVLTDNFTAAELTEINQSAEARELIATPEILQEMEMAIRSLGDRYAADETWITATYSELAVEIPSLFEPQR